VPVVVLAAAKTERSTKAYDWQTPKHRELYNTVRKLAHMSDITAAAAMKAMNNMVLFRKALIDGGYNSKYELKAALAEVEKVKSTSKAT
jgi:hypothetical protein